MTTNVDVLLNLKNQIFVDEVLTKTRANGLQWAQLAPNTFQVSICEAGCQSPATPSTNWTMYVTRNQSNVGPDNNYNYYLEVLQGNYPYLTISSLAVDQVETLYLQIDLLLT